MDICWILTKLFCGYCFHWIMDYFILLLIYCCKFIDWDFAIFGWLLMLPMIKFTSISLSISKYACRDFDVYISAWPSGSPFPFFLQFHSQLCMHFFFHTLRTMFILGEGNFSFSNFCESFFRFLGLFFSLLFQIFKLLFQICFFSSEFTLPFVWLLSRNFAFYFSASYNYSIPFN